MQTRCQTQICLLYKCLYLNVGSKLKLLRVLYRTSEIHSQMQLYGQNGNISPFHSCCVLSRQVSRQGWDIPGQMGVFESLHARMCFQDPFYRTDSWRETTRLKLNVARDPRLPFDPVVRGYGVLHQVPLDTSVSRDTPSPAASRGLQTAALVCATLGRRPRGTLLQAAHKRLLRAWALLEATAGTSSQPTATAGVLRSAWLWRVGRILHVLVFLLLAGTFYI